MFHKIPIKKVRLGLLTLVGMLALIVLPATVIGRPSVAPAAVPEPVSEICETGDTTTTPGTAVFDLETKTGHLQTPDGNSILMWTYNLDGEAFQIPSPVLCVNEGVEVTINLTNNLDEATSIIFPGQMGVSATGDVLPPTALFTAEANDGGGTATYSFIAEEPGTYLYESGTEPHKQVEMGLYGALIIRPTMGANFAYNDETTKFDPNREFLILIHDMDSDLHQAVERGDTYDITTKHDHYWTINGRSFPDVLAPNDVPWLPNQPYGALVWIEAVGEAPANPEDLPPGALIRYINAGLENHPYHPHGNHMRVIGRDGRPLSLPFENFGTTIGSGQTYDLLFWWVNVEGWFYPGGAGPLIRDQVTYPNILNLVFKDGVTWFSGDPDLGLQADLPPDTTIFNECGEFYFPWHSHALNEFQNFDEGFGGLATLVRVDPPGGCP